MSKADVARPNPTTMSTSPPLTVHDLRAAAEAIRAKVRAAELDIIFGPLPALKTEPIALSALLFAEAKRDAARMVAWSLA